MMKKAKVMVPLALLSGGVILFSLLKEKSLDEKREAVTLPEKVEEKPAMIERSEEEKRARSAIANAEASRLLRFDQSQAELLNDPLDRSQLSDDALALEDPNIEEQAAMRALHSLLGAIRYTSKEKSYPSGLNVEVTNALLGKNSRKVGYLPGDSPRINENGELVDGLGTPYWFHNTIDNKLEIFSAGPDQMMHTADDVELTP